MFALLFARAIVLFLFSNCKDYFKNVLLMWPENKHRWHNKKHKEIYKHYKQTLNMLIQEETHDIICT